MDVDDSDEAQDYQQEGIMQLGEDEACYGQVLWMAGEEQGAPPAQGQRACTTSQGEGWPQLA